MLMSILKCYKYAINATGMPDEHTCILVRPDTKIETTKYFMRKKINKTITIES